MTSVQKRTDQLPDTYRDHQWESSGTEDVAPQFPIIKIVQATSSMPGAGKHAGEFYRTDLEEFYPELEIVPLFQKKVRAYFEEGNDMPSCASDDGHFPRDNQPLWVGDEPPQGGCAYCPFSKWGEDGTPPSCRESTMVLVDHLEELAQLRISGKSMKPWKQFVARKLQPRKLPLCSQRVTLVTEEMSEPGRKWYELRVSSEQLPIEEALRYNAVLNYERARFQEASSEEPVAAGDEWIEP